MIKGNREDGAAPLTKKELGKNVNLKNTIKKVERQEHFRQRDYKYNDFLQKESAG